MEVSPLNPPQLVLSTQIDHAISTYNFTTPDFTVSKHSLLPKPKANNIVKSAQFRFPFIDLLGDGSSTFSYIPTIYISNDPIAIAGARAYYEDAIVATFNPPLDPYAAVPGSRDKELFFDVFLNGTPVLNATFRPQWGVYGEVGDYPLSL